MNLFDGGSVQACASEEGSEFHLVCFMKFDQICGFNARFWQLKHVNLVDFARIHHGDTVDQVGKVFP